MLRLASLIFRNVLRNRRRSLLTLASTAVSLCVLGIMVGVYFNFFLPKQNSPNEALRVITRHRVSLTQSMPAAYQQKIAAVDGVVAVSAWQWFGGVYKDERDPNNGFAQFGVDADKILTIHADLTLPDDQKQAFIKTRTGCIVARRLANRFNFKIGDRMPLKSEIFDKTLELDIVGIFDHPPNNDYVLFHREYFSELLKGSGGNGADADMIGCFALLARSPEEIPRIARAVDIQFENAPAQTKTESEKEFGLSFLAFLGNIKLYLGVICAAVTFTILLVSANTVAMAVRERTREMAILRTLGFTPGEILQMVIAEAAFVGVLGGAIGAVLAWMFLKVLSTSTPWFETLSLRWEGAVFVVAVSAVVGVMSAIFPAYFASRKGIVESLRFAG